MTDEQGANMIVDLQKMAGVEEPYDIALANWKNFSESQKLNTMRWHTIFFGETNDNSSS